MFILMQSFNMNSPLESIDVFTKVKLTPLCDVVFRKVLGVAAFIHSLEWDSVWHTVFCGVWMVRFSAGCAYFFCKI